MAPLARRHQAADHLTDRPAQSRGPRQDSEEHGEIAARKRPGHGSQEGCSRGSPCAGSHPRAMEPEARTAEKKRAAGRMNGPTEAKTASWNIPSGITTRGGFRRATTMSFHRSLNIAPCLPAQLAGPAARCCRRSPCPRCESTEPLMESSVPPLVYSTTSSREARSMMTESPSCPRNASASSVSASKPCSPRRTPRKVPAGSRSSRSRPPFHQSPALEDLVLGRGEDHAAALDEGDVVGDALEVRGDVGRKQNRRALVLKQVGQAVEQISSEDRIQPDVGSSMMTSSARWDEGESKGELRLVAARKSAEALLQGSPKLSASP